MPGCGRSLARHECRPTWRIWTLGWSYNAGFDRSNSTCSPYRILATIATLVQTRQLSLDLAPLEVSPSSDWCQRWCDRRPRWRHRSEGGFDTTQYEAAPIDDRTAKAYVERNHFAASYVASRLRYGLWNRQGA